MAFVRKVKTYYYLSVMTAGKRVWLKHGIRWLIVRGNYK